MKRKSFFLSILAPEKRLLTWVLSLIVFFLLPYPTLGQTSITADTTLTGNHIGSISIDADGVTLDCNGFSVLGTGSGNGIELTDRSGVRVRRCNVEGFREGFRISGSDNNTFDENMSGNNVRRGFRIIASDDSTFTENTSENNGRQGFFISGSDNNTFDENMSGNNVRQGFFISGSDNNTFDENISENNVSQGFFILSSDNNTFAANIIHDNNGDGIRLISSNSNSISQNTISNSGSGIIISGTANTVDANTISSVPGGIGFRGSSDSFITNNIISNIAFFGIFGGGSSQGTDRNLIAGNTIRDVGSELTRVSAWGVGIDMGGGFTTGPTTSFNDNIVENNLIEGAESAGIEIRQSGGPEHDANLEELFGNVLRNNEVRESGTGIRIDGGTAENVVNRQFDGTVITGNTLEANTQLTFPDYEGNSGPSYPLPLPRIPTTGSGIQIINVGGVEVSKNTITGNAASGIHLDNAPDTLVFQNDVFDNNGFQVERIGPAYSPLAIASDGTNVFVSDSDNLIRKFSPTGVLLNTFGGSGTALGEFSMILGLDVDGGFIYASDTDNRRLQKLDTAGTPLLVFDTPPSVSGLNLGLEGLDVRGTKVIVTDTDGKRVLVYNTAGLFINRLDAGPCGEIFGNCTPGTGTVNKPYDVAIDSLGDIYVSEFVLHLQRDSAALPLDRGANRVQKFDPSGNVLFQLGTSGSNIFRGTNEGSPVGTSDGEFDSPLGIAVDSSDDLYVVDSNNNRVQKFNSSGDFLTKWGSFGSGNGQFDVPVGIAIDNADNVYVADHEGNRIQKFSSSGAFITSWTTDPLSQAIEMSLKGIGNYWGRNCGMGPNGAPLFQPGVDSNALDVLDSNPFRRHVSDTPVETLQALPCPE